MVISSSLGLLPNRRTSRATASSFDSAVSSVVFPTTLAASMPPFSPLLSTCLSGSSPLAATSFADTTASLAESSLSDCSHYHSPFQHPKRRSSDTFSAVSLYQQIQCLPHHVVIWPHQRNFHNGPSHPNTLNSRLCLARNYADQGELERAEEIETDVLHITERTQGPEHPDTFHCIINLATAYRDTRQLEKAETLRLAALEKARLALGSEHHFTVTLMRNLTKTYSLQIQMPKATKFQEEVVDSESLQSQTDSDASSAMNELAEMYEANGLFDDPIRYRKRRLAMFKDSAKFG